MGPLETPTQAWQRMKGLMWGAVRAESTCVSNTSEPHCLFSKAVAQPLWLAKKAVQWSAFGVTLSLLTNGWEYKESCRISSQGTDQLYIKGQSVNKFLFLWKKCFLDSSHKWYVGSWATVYDGIIILYIHNVEYQTQVLLWIYSIFSGV